MSNCSGKEPANRHTSAICDDHTETDNITSIELQRNRRLLYFSDGTMEDISDSENETAETDTDLTDKCLEVTINENELPIASRLKYKATKVGGIILAGLDYIGGGLASVLGITTPKFSSEIEYYQRSMVNSYGNPEDENSNDTWGRAKLSKDANKTLNEVITEDVKRIENAQEFP